MSSFIKFSRILSSNLHITACKQYCLAAGATQGNIAYTQNVTTNAKRQTTHNKMTLNGFDIQAILTKRTDFQIDRILLLKQVTEKKRKSRPFTFFKISFCLPALHTFGFAQNTIRPFAKPKECNFFQRTN